MKRIYYTPGKKYQLEREYHMQVDFPVEHTIVTDYISLRPDGSLIIRAGYAWDGPSGLSLDTKTFMRGSLVHDALYELLRAGRLPQARRLDADKLLRKLCIEDGMTAVRAWYVYQMVRQFGGTYAEKQQKTILSAPEIKNTSD